MKDLRLPSKLAWAEKEDALQTECMKWLKKELYNRDLPQLAYHPPNGGNRNQREASRLKLQGVLPGVSDVVLPMRSEGYSGVYCELKKKGGTISEDQIKFLTGVEAEGYLAIVVNDLETFKEVFTYYLDNRKTKQ